MFSQCCEELLEKVPHITNLVPYSIHKTDFSNQMPFALYLHFHPEFEFLFLSEGLMEVNINNTLYRLNSGEALFIPPNLLHSAKALSEKGTFYAIVFLGKFLTENQKLSHYFSFGFGNETDGKKYILHLTKTIGWHADILLYLNRIFFNSVEFKPADVFIKNHLLIIGEYLDKYHISSNVKNIKNNVQIQEVLIFIHNNYQKDISLEEMAGIAHMSKEHLCRVFRKNTGYTPFSYLKYYRILKSCDYLKYTNKKITEICGICGFNNISYFNREFLNIMKMTPSYYRNNM